MNYPLAEAILGYVGGSSLDMAVVQGHQEYRRHVHPLDGAAFAGRLVELLGVYDPDVVAVQLNLLGSHDSPRVRSVLGGDLAAVRMATLLQCLLPGAPCIYYGDEIGLMGGNDPANRAGFPWDGSHWETDLRAFVRATIALRAAEPALRHGATTAIGTSGPAMALERRLDATRIVLAVNPGDEPVELPITLDDVGAGRLEPVPLPGEIGPPAMGIADGRSGIPLAARSAAVFRVTAGDA
jgi:neopullulanase